MDSPSAVEPVIVQTLNEAFAEKSRLSAHVTSVVMYSQHSVELWVETWLRGLGSFFS